MRRTVLSAGIAALLLFAFIALWESREAPPPFSLTDSHSRSAPRAVAPKEALHLPAIPQAALEPEPSPVASGPAPVLDAEGFCHAASAQEIWYRISPSLDHPHTTERRYFFQLDDARMLIVRQLASDDGVITLSVARWEPGAREVGNQEFNERQSARGYLEPEAALAAVGPAFVAGVLDPRPTLTEERVEANGLTALLHNTVAVELNWSAPSGGRTRNLRCPRDADCECVE